MTTALLLAAVFSVTCQATTAASVLRSGHGSRWSFVQEAKAASALKHPHIVTIHESESVDGLDSIVMQHVPGRTLDALILKSGGVEHATSP